MMRLAKSTASGLLSSPTSRSDGETDGTLTHVRAANDHATKPQLQAERWVPYATDIDIDTLAYPLLHAEMTSEAATRLMAPALLQRMKKG